MSEQYIKNVLITGGAGFIGSHVVKRMVKQYPKYKCVNLDALTYAGNLENLTEIEGKPNYTFIKGDITDLDFIHKVFKEQIITDVIHLAAESHVDRSIHDPSSFLKTNVLGTLNLLLVAKDGWASDLPNHRFYHISTDEVYGSLGPMGSFTEETPYDPRSPYSASKAGSDHLVSAFFHTYGLPVILSNCSNNYGPYQFPEKLIPLIINNILEGRELPVYGTGSNVRDWLWVGDHAQAIDLLFHRGVPGEKYNIGGNCERTNLQLVEFICQLMEKKLERETGSILKTIRFVPDRLGHDLRYAIDATKMKEQMGWMPSKSLEEGIAETIDWYLRHREWLSRVTSGAYRDYYEQHYGH